MGNICNEECEKPGNTEEDKMKYFLNVLGTSLFIRSSVFTVCEHRNNSVRFE